MCTRGANDVIADTIVARAHRSHLRLLSPPSPSPTLFRLQVMSLSASDPRTASLMSCPSHTPSLASTRGHGKLLTCMGCYPVSIRSTHCRWFSFIYPMHI